VWLFLGCDHRRLTPSKPNMVPRVARKLIDFDDVIKIAAPAELVATLKESLWEIDDASAIESVAISGPAWRRIDAAEADALPAELAFQIVPVRGDDGLMIAYGVDDEVWSTFEVTIEAVDVRGAVLGSFEISIDGASARFTSAAGCASSLDASVASLLTKLVSASEPDPEHALAAMPSESLDTHAFGESAFSLPAWVGELILRFACNTLRVHCVFDASRDDNSNRPLTLDHGGHAFATTFRGRSRTRCAFAFHASNKCICGAHHSNAPPPRPKRVVLSLEFCGGRPTQPGRCGMCAASRGGCGVSGVSGVSGLARCACVSFLKMQLRCLHDDTSGKAMAVTTVELPTSDGFVGALAGAVSELMRGETPAASVKAALCAASRAASREQLDRLELKPSELCLFDEIAIELLLTGDFFYGAPPGRCNGRREIRRIAGGSVPAFVREISASHGHLLPTQPPRL